MVVVAISSCPVYREIKIGVEILYLALLLCSNLGFEISMLRICSKRLSIITIRQQVSYHYHYEQRFFVSVRNISQQQNGITAKKKQKTKQIVRLGTICQFIEQIENSNVYTNTAHNLVMKHSTSMVSDQLLN